MSHQQKQTLYREDEEQKPIRVSGEYFWRSIWKGIENSRSATGTVPRERNLSLVAPRDYVVESEQGLRS